jgi:hypothetical protein
VIVAVLAVRMMQVPADHEVGMIAVRHLSVAALRVVLVPAGVVAARVLRRARGRVGAVDADCMLVGVSCMNVVQVSVVQIVGVAIMLDRNVAAAGAVRVRMTGMLLAGHGLSLFGLQPLQGKRHDAIHEATGLRAAPRTPG